MNRIDRLSAILIHLQGKPRVTLSDLVGRFEVSERTIFRDMKSLMEAGVPIGGEAGSGYFVVEGYHLPPVVFTREEAAALLMGAKLIEHHADKEIVNQFEEAMYKVKAVLRFNDKDFLDNLEKNITVLPSSRNATKGFPSSYISTIQIALATQRLLMLEYHSNYQDKTTTREVEPLGLVYYASRWHLIAWCRLRQEMRDFRCDRILKCVVLAETLAQDKHPDYLKFLNRMMIGTDSYEAVIRISQKTARFISEQKFFYGFAEEKVDGDEIEMKFFPFSYHSFARWIMMFGSEVSIVYPEELQQLASRFANDLSVHYAKT